MTPNNLTEAREARTCSCGMLMSANRHSDAGKPEHLLDVGAMYVCIPCTVSSRHQWAERAQKAEAALDQTEALTAERDALRQTVLDDHQRLNEAHEENNQQSWQIGLLISDIWNVAIKTGIANSEVTPDGPQALLLLEDILTQHQSLTAQRDIYKAALEEIARNENEVFDTDFQEYVTVSFAEDEMVEIARTALKAGGQ